MISAAAIPYLPRGVRVHDDRVRGMKVLLAPERAMKLEPTGVAILGEIDGRASFGEIVARLATRYDAPADRIAEDAARFLGGLIDRRMVEVQ